MGLIRVLNGPRTTRSHRGSRTPERFSEPAVRLTSSPESLWNWDGTPSVDDDGYAPHLSSKKGRCRITSGV